MCHAVLTSLLKNIVVFSKYDIVSPNFDDRFGCRGNSHKFMTGAGFRCDAHFVNIYCSRLRCFLFAFAVCLRSFACKALVCYKSGLASPRKLRSHYFYCNFAFSV